MSFRMTSLATTTMNQLQKKLDTVGHNLANSNTTGYKERQAEFSDILSQQIDNLTPADQAGPRRTPEGIRQGIGARLGAINNKLDMGSIEKSDRELDNVLLQENHLFQVQAEHNGEEEVQYTRDGVFYLQPTSTGDNMMLVTKEGQPVLGQNGPIEFSANQVTKIQMDDDGSVLVQRNGQPEWENVGTLSVTEAVLPRSLEAVGDNQFRVPDEVNEADILQAIAPQGQLLENGAVEMSNVSIQDQMTEMINAQRSYQMNARTVTMGDEMQGLVNQLR